MHAGRPCRPGIEEWRPDALVVGVPFHPDGAAHDNTRRAQRFARQLRARLACPSMKWMSATAPPKRMHKLRRTLMRPLQQSSWSNS